MHMLAGILIELRYHLAAWRRHGELDHHILARLLVTLYRAQRVALYRAAGATISEVCVGTGASSARDWVPVA